MEAGKTLCNANLDCCGNLLSLLTGFEHIVHEVISNQLVSSVFIAIAITRFNFVRWKRIIKSLVLMQIVDDAVIVCSFCVYRE